MKCDRLGNVYCTGPGGVWVFSPNGTHIGSINLPNYPANIAFGGSNWNVLFTTSQNYVFAVQLKVASAMQPFMK